MDQSPSGEYWTRHGARRPRLPGRNCVGPNRLAASIPMPLWNRSIQPWRTIRDAIADLPKPARPGDPCPVTNHIYQPGAKSYTGHTGSPLDFPSKALKAGVHGVPGGENMIRLPNGHVRYFSVREAARVQTFPDCWQFRGAWSEAMRQLGNAVPVLFAQAIAEQLAAGLDRGAHEVRTLQSAGLRESDPPRRTGTA